VPSIGRAATRHLRREGRGMERSYKILDLMVAADLK
jgi:hypothetical protein